MDSYHGVMFVEGTRLFVLDINGTTISSSMTCCLAGADSLKLH